MAQVEISRLTRAHHSDLNEETILQYMAAPGYAEPVLVFEDPRTGELTLANGNHRVEAAIRPNVRSVEANIIRGTRHEATAYRDLR